MLHRAYGLIFLTNLCALILIISSESVRRNLVSQDSKSFLQTNGNDDQVNISGVPIDSLDISIDGEPVFGASRPLEGESTTCLNNCSYRGACTLEGKCICADGWSDNDCSVRDCNPSCGENGLCSNDICKCKPFWRGSTCSIETCQDKDCSGHGKCNEKKSNPTCECDDGWKGVACDNPACPSGSDDDSVVCGGNGSCSQDMLCICDEGYRGVDCTLKDCPYGLNNEVCSNNGNCNLDTSTCICDEFYEGSNCSIKQCKFDCHHGHCSNGLCVCNDGYEGEQCVTKSCPDNCNDDHGICVDGVCFCKSGWTSLSCDTRTCPNQCSNNGVCNDAGVCECNNSWRGLDCSEKTCVNECSSHGNCDPMSLQCTCDAGWEGKDCSLRSCPDNCSDRGICDTNTGLCLCSVGYRGVSCDTLTCPPYNDHNNNSNNNNINNNSIDVCFGNGYCDESTGLCSCNDGYSGVDCHVTPCPSDETGVMCGGEDQGSCNTSTQKCECLPRYYGDACEKKTCLPECENGGLCTEFGLCECLEGQWRGLFCEEMQCPEDCNGHGVCGLEKDFECLCDVGWNPENHCRTCSLGWEGEQCSEHTNTCSADKCNYHGTCAIHSSSITSTTTNIDNDNYDNKHDDDNNDNAFMCTCESNWNGDDRCSSCSDGWVGDECETNTHNCPNQCSNHGKCISDSDGEYTTCQCDSHFTGDSCEQCVYGWRGVDCQISINKCPNECSQHGTCAMNTDNEFICVCDNHWDGKSCDKCSEGFAGDHCEIDLSCSDDCLGKCIDSKCACDETHRGVNCNIMICDEYHYGTNCDFPICPGEVLINETTTGNHRTFCGGKGMCLPETLECLCDAGYTGKECEVKRCPGTTLDGSIECNGNGICSDGICICNESHTGTACAMKLCPDTKFNKQEKNDDNSSDTSNSNEVIETCNNHGECDYEYGICKCTPPYRGVSCLSIPCPGMLSNGLTCSGYGVCEASGKCSCDEDHIYEDCSGKRCPDNCSNQGLCDGETGICICDEGFLGVDCALIDCPGSCNEGDCNYAIGRCECRGEAYGSSCDQYHCPNDCSGHGECNGMSGTCDCKNGYMNNDCSTKPCEVMDCNNNGVCDTSVGVCNCYSNWEGKQCDIQLTNASLPCAVTCSTLCVNQCEPQILRKSKSLKDVGTCFSDCNDKCIDRCINEQIALKQ